MRPLLATLRRLSVRPDPVLLQGREGRWRWPWAVTGLLVTLLGFAALGLVVVKFEDLVVSRGWIAGGFPESVFPVDPAQPVTYLGVLLASLPFLIPPLIALLVVHGVSWRRAFAYAGHRFRWSQFGRAAFALLTLALLGLAAGYLYEPQQYRFPGPQPALWILLAVAVIFVQSLGEEVLFRGYLLRTWGAILPFRLPITAAIVGLFVAGHLENEDLQRDLLLNVIYFIAGEVIAYAVLFRTLNLAASAGLHWMNNVLALLIPTIPGQPTTLGLVVYTDPVYAAGGSRLFDPFIHLVGIAGMGLLVTMLFWHRSPFYLEKAPPARRDTTHGP